jgi:hypothetical protein
MSHQPFSPSTTQVVALGAASAATTNAVGSQTRAVRLIATEPVHVYFLKAPTATTSHMYLAADREEIFGIAPGQKVAGIQGGTGGNLYVTELTHG